MKAAVPFMIALSAGLLAGCGGGDGGAMPAPPPLTVAPPSSDLPSSARLDPQSATDFVSSIAGKKSESAEPLATGDDGNLATSETAEPTPL
jgi:hypothetical protein